MYAKNVYHMDQNAGKVNCSCSHCLASKSSFDQICHLCLKGYPKNKVYDRLQSDFVEISKSLHA